MSGSLLGVLIYSTWTMLLVLIIPAQRVPLIMSGNRDANSFGADGTDVSPFAQRVCRAHANCYENLPIFLGIVLVAVLSDHAEITNSLAPWVAGFRIAQSSVHLASTSNNAVTLRFVFFLLQYAILLYCSVRLLTVALAG